MHIKHNESLVMVLPITDRCNGMCVMCGIWRRKPRADSSISKLEGIFTQNGLSNAVTHLNITGGDPFLHPKLTLLADVASRRLNNLREVTIGTSTTFPKNIGEIFLEFRKMLKPAIMLQVAVSLDGTEAAHDKVRGIDGAYRRAIEAIRHLQKLCVSGNMAVSINCTFSAVNFDAVTDVIQRATDLNVYLSLTYACHNDLYLGNNHYAKDFCFNEKTTQPLLACIQEWLNSGHISKTEKHYLEMTSSMLQGQKRGSGCVLQKNGLFLDINNTAYPCGTVSSLPYGSLDTHSFHELFYSKRADEIRNELMEKHCPHCLSNSYYGLGDGTWLKVLRERRRRA